MNPIHNSEILKLGLQVECRIGRKAEFKDNLTSIKEVQEGFSLKILLFRSCFLFAGVLCSS
jgi:hypothetical protein